MSTIDLHRGAQTRRDLADGRRLRPPVAVAAMAALALVAAAACLVLTRGTTFEADEWLWALQRRGGSASAFLDSWNGHFSLVPVIVYKLLWATSGLRSYVPYRLIVTALHVVCGTLVFTYARRRIGDLLALAAAAMILFFGPGWQEFLWPFQLAWLISITAGVGALLALDRGDRAGAVTACALLTCAVASSGPAVAILAGVILEVALRADRRRLWWVVAVPLAIYVLWWAGYQTATITSGAVHQAPAFTLHLIAATLSALLGLYGAEPGRHDWGPHAAGVVLVVLAAAISVWRLARGRRIWPRATGLVAIVVLYAIAVAVNRGGFGSGADSRYLYVAAVFVLLAIAELARDAPLAPPTVAVLTVGAAITVVSNFGAERTAARYLRNQAVLVRADLGALEIGRANVVPGYVATHFPGWPFIALSAAGYYAVRRDLGTPAAAPASLVAYPEQARETADAELIGIDRVALAPVSHARSDARCRQLTAPLEVALPAAGLRVAAGPGPAVVSLRRFARAFTPLGVVAPGTVRSLRMRPDGSQLRWYASISPHTSARLCDLP